MGANLCGHSLVTSRGLLMARLREALDSDWSWEAPALTGYARPVSLNVVNLG
jgi:hypothetical protein